MSAPQLTSAQIEQVSGLVGQYIGAQREGFRPDALALTAEQRAGMTGFFSPELLDGTRLVVLTGTRVENPTFYPLLIDMGFRNLPDFSLMGAITFCDVVVSHQRFTDRLLFHELVHVEQYRQLGIPRFAELYVRGFLVGGGYDGIPLEINAYSLDTRFYQAPHQQFQVEGEVRGWIRDGRF
jgi:hypothetical protein